MIYAVYTVIALVALIHIYILWLEMFAWETKGKEAFKGSLPSDLFAPTKVLAANQGLYNGFLAAGLIWSLCIRDVQWQQQVALFFLGCVFIAGLYGTMTASKKILFVQAIPAGLGIALIVIQSLFS